MIYDDKQFIGKTIQNIRKKSKMKQSEFAELIGISEKHLSKIETGKNLPSLDNFLKMASVLKFSLEDFGIKTERKKNAKRESLLKMIYSASDYELESYLKILTALKDIIESK